MSPAVLLSDWRDARPSHPARGHGARPIDAPEPPVAFGREANTGPRVLPLAGDLSQQRDREIVDPAFDDGVKLGFEDDPMWRALQHIAGKEGVRL